MKLNHCDNCERELELAFERYEIGEYITHGNLHFCHNACQEEYHKEHCDPVYNESDQVSSTCSNCDFHSEHSEL